MSGERQRIEEEIRRLAFGEVAGVSGRELTARTTALRTLERLSRPDDEQSSTPVRERLDYPCGPDGRFDPSCDPSFWKLRLGWRWKDDDDREAAALEEWERWGGRERWQQSGRPWAHSEWLVDREPWDAALRELGGGRYSKRRLAAR